MFVMHHSIFPSGAGFSWNRLCAFKIWNMLIATIVLLEAPYAYYSVLNMFPNYLNNCKCFSCIHKGQWAVKGNKGETFLQTYKL